MRQTKLVLIEGIPGSGNTRKQVPALAQFLLDQYRRRDVPARWPDEEDRANPAVCYHSRSSLQQVRDDLTSGNYRWQASAPVYVPATAVLLSGT